MNILNNCGVAEAAELMELFIESGNYPHLKQTEQKIKLLTSSIRERLEDSELKRHEFSNHQLVGRFTARKIYETNIFDLNQYLYDLGLLLHVIEVDHKKIQEDNFLYFDMIQEFKLRDTYYIKPNFNKVGRTLNKISDNFRIDERWNLEDMARSLSILKPQKTYSENKYEKLKWEMARLIDFDFIRKMSDRKLPPAKHKYGSISIVSHTPRYDISAIYDYIGEWLLLEYGVPNYQKLDSFIINGTITQKEIDQFKLLKDIRLDFSIMSLEDERRLFEFLDNKQKITAMNRWGA